MLQGHSDPCHTLPNCAFASITHLPLPLCSFLSQCLGCKTPRTCHTVVALSHRSHTPHSYRVWLFVLWCTALYRTTVSVSSRGPEPEDSSPKEKATRLHGRAETELRKRPYIVKFPGGQAGAVYANQAVDDNLNASYTHKVGSAENPFYPFSSNMEWEIARWAKMRGPSSTAFTELMNIEGVSFFSFMMYRLDWPLNSRLLNGWGSPSRIPQSSTT